MSAWVVEKRHGSDWEAGRIYASEAEALAVADGLPHTETRVVECPWLDITAGPEPSKAEVEAGARALFVATMNGDEFAGDMWDETPDDAPRKVWHRDLARAVLTASHARQEADG